MLAVIPISLKDAHLAESFQKALKKFHPGANHSALIVASPAAKELAVNLGRNLQDSFSQLALEIFTADNNQDWPRACNFYFQQAVRLVPKYAKPNQGFLWLELDSVPVTNNWMDILEQEYYSDSQIAHQERRNTYRFMGATEQTIKSFGGELNPTAGHHMASVGVYPADFGITCPVLNGLQNQNVHFSVHLKWYTTIHKNVPQLNVTKFIQNNRDTEKYREENGQIICDTVAGIPRNAFGVEWNNPLSRDTVLLHGCKDGSLIEVVSADRKVEWTPKQVSIPTVQPTRKPFSYATQPLPHPIAPVAPTSKIVEQTVVVHQPLPKATTIQTFGQHGAMGLSKTAAQYDEQGNPLAAIPEYIPPYAPIIVQPEQPKAEDKPPVPRSYKGKNRRKVEWTPERRAAQAERMRLQQAKKRTTSEQPA